MLQEPLTDTRKEGSQGSPSLCCPVPLPEQFETQLYHVRQLSMAVQETRDIAAEYEERQGHLTSLSAYSTGKEKEREIEQTQIDLLETQATRHQLLARECKERCDLILSEEETRCQAPYVIVHNALQLLPSLQADSGRFYRGLPWGLGALVLEYLSEVDQHPVMLTNKAAYWGIRGLHVCRSIAVNLLDVSSTTQRLVLQRARQVEGFFPRVLRQFEEIYTDLLTPTCPRVTAVGRAFLCVDRAAAEEAGGVILSGHPCHAVNGLFSVVHSLGHQRSPVYVRSIQTGWEQQLRQIFLIHDKIQSAWCLSLSLWDTGQRIASVRTKARLPHQITQQRWLLSDPEWFEYENLSFQSWLHQECQGVAPR